MTALSENEKEEEPMDEPKRETMDWITDESLPDCPFCGDNAREFTEDGKQRWFDGVRIKHKIERVGWWRLYPPEKQWCEWYAVCCVGCGASGGRRTNITAAKEAWAARVRPGMTDTERETAKRAATGDLPSATA